MAPRALTSQEKKFQKHKIIISAKDLLLDYGIKKVSVDDIIKAADTSRATFYSHFSSKEELLQQLALEIHQDVMAEIQQIILESKKTELRYNMETLLRSLIYDREKVFFFVYRDELNSLLVSLNSEKTNGIGYLECQAYLNLIRLAGLNDIKVKTGVIHNLLHAIYLISSDSSLLQDDLEDTISIMINSLLDYIFGDETQGKNSK